MARIVSGPEITGIVVDKNTGAPLKGVTVTVSATVYTDPDFTSGTTTLTTDRAGVFNCYAANGTYTFTTTSPQADTIEPVTVRGTGGPSGGTAGSSQGLPSNILTKTANYTAAAGDFVQANAAGGGFTVTLPSAPAVGALVTVKKIDTGGNTVSVAPSGSGTIDGQATASILSPQFGGIFEHVGSDVWKVVAPTAAGGTNGTNGAISQIQANGTNQTVRPTLNLIGFTVADNAGNSSTDVTAPSGGGSGAPLAVVEYGGHAGAYSTSSATLGAVDTTNLVLTFTVPASGKVILAATGRFQGATGPVGCQVGWLNASGGAQVGGIKPGSLANLDAARTLRWYITGLTGGASITLQLAFRSSTGGTTVQIWNDSTNGNSGSTTLEAWAA